MLNKSKYFNHVKDCFGIYTIRQHGSIVYIGMTYDKFSTRFLAHKNFQSNYGLRDAINEGGCVFEPIHVYEKWDKDFMTKYDLMKMEAELIRRFKPKFNTQFKHLDFEEQLANDVRLGRYTAKDVESWKQ